eukprot:157291_1
MEFVLSGLGKEIAPLSVLRIVFKTYHFLVGTQTKRILLKKNTIRNIFSKAVTPCLEIRSVKTWKEMSTMLICLAVLWALEPPQKHRYVSDSMMANIYSHLCCIEKRGSTYNILENIKHTYGEYIQYLEDKTTKKILNEKQEITKYGYCLWYNVLYCVFPDPKPTNSEHVLNRVLNALNPDDDALNPIPVIPHLFTLVCYDLTFAAHNRAIKMEDLFMRSLLSPKTNVQQLSSAVKYDYMMQLLAKLSDIEQVYAFLISFKTELHHLIGNDMESSWCVFVHYMLS